MALKRIMLRDFVIVRELELDLESGFSVLTGETGAGKSILIDALQLALGARAEATVVREGATRADISAEFDYPQALEGWFDHWFDEAGFDKSESLLLRRTIDAQGKSRAYVNGSPATAAQLKELGEQLVDIHGQHAWQSLTRPTSVRGLLDAYAGVSTASLVAPWTAWREAQKTLEQSRANQDTLQRERERLSWQITEVDKLAPRADEWEELNTSHSRLSNAQALLDAAQLALTALDDDDKGAIAQLSHAQTALASQQHVEPDFDALAQLLASSLAQAEDAAHTLNSYLRKTELDPDKLAELDERMGSWMSLARRYKRTPEDLPGLLASWKDELGRLDLASDPAALEQAEQKAKSAYMTIAREISKSRAKAAPKLSAAVTTAMQGLGMKGGRFAVEMTISEEPSPSGLDDIAFLVSGHEGSTPRPVGKVASGGELSRIALAIAVTTSELGTAQTLIFDEVDSGVGGAVAETVGRLMKQLGRDRQVMAVTHLPQVAACGDHHLVVSKQPPGKSEVKGVTSSVSPVVGEARVTEVARMLGGETLSSTTLAHAREMLNVSAAKTGKGAKA